MSYGNKILSFAIALATAILAMTIGARAQGPTLIEPADGIGCMDLIVDFQWQALQDADAYNVEIATDDQFNNIVVTENAQGNTQIQAIVPDRGTLYYWRVVALMDDATMRFSAVRSFTTRSEGPALLDPPDGTDCSMLEISLDWENDPNALNYLVQISHSDDFSALLKNETPNFSEYSTTLSDWNADYYWRVASSFSDGAGDYCLSEWSDVFMFSTAENPPELIGPADGASEQALNVTLSWTSSETPDDYWLQVSTSDDFSTTLIDVADISSSSTTASVAPPDYGTEYFWRISSDFGGCRTDWSDVFSFTTKYAPPTVIAPQNGEICVPTTFEFEWEDVGAGAYAVEIALDPDFTNLVLQSSDIQATSLVTTLTLNNTDYYIRVRAEDADNSGEWGPTTMFTTTFGPPEHIAPTNDTGGYPLQVDLEWEDYGPDAMYRLQIADDDTFASTVVDIHGLEEPEYSVALTDYNEDYYWRVSATVSSTFSECSSTWSDPWVFRTMLDAPELLTPTNFAINQPTEIFFDWTDVDGAETYEFLLSLGSDFIQTDIVHGKDAHIESNIIVQDIPEGETLFWKARASNSDGYGKWSSTFSFETGANLPDRPVLIKPDNEKTGVPVDVVLDWAPADRANSYDIQVATNSNFTNLIVDETGLTETSYDLSGLNNFNEYHWRVRGVNSVGNSEWSDIWSFRTIDVAPEDPPLLSTPMNDETGLETHVRFRWETVERARTYQIQVARDENFVEGELVNNTTNIRRTYYDFYDYEYSTEYKWRVRAFNEAGSGPWSDIWTFTTGEYVSVQDETASDYLGTVYPNPFGQAATIEIAMPKNAEGELAIYDAVGSKISVIYSGTFAQGANRFEIDSAELPAGVYYYTLNAGEISETRSFVVIK